MTRTSMHKDMLSYHVHHDATDRDGNPFLVVVNVWTKEEAMSIRCWSVDGTARNVHWYFPKLPIGEYVPRFLDPHNKDLPGIGDFLAKQKGLAVKEQDNEILSTDWKTLSNLRTLKIVKETTKKEEDGYVNATTYLQVYFGWEYTVVTGPCLSKQLAVDAGFRERDLVFKSCRILLRHQEAAKAAKLISKLW